MTLLLKAHPINQAITRGVTCNDLNDAGIRRNPGEPSIEDAKTGDYKKPVIKWRGMIIRIENPAGSVRRGKNWETRMKYDYGYISGSNGVDGDEVDVYVGPHLEDAKMVYVVHQRKYGNWDKYDEDKCLIGFMSEDEAKAAYLAHYDDQRFLGPVTAMPTEEFIAKVRQTRSKGKMIKSIVLFFKAHVKGHTRRLKSGKVIYVNAYTNKVAARQKSNSKQLSLFADDDFVEPNKAAAAEHERVRRAVNTTSHEKEKKTYQYGLRYRPAGLSTVPTGFHSENSHPSFRHGVISYNRPLTDDELKSFELTPIVGIQEHARKLIEKMGRYASKYAENQEALEDFVNQNARSIGLWSTDDTDTLTNEVARQLKEGLAKSDKAKSRKKVAQAELPVDNEKKGKRARPGAKKASSSSAAVSENTPIGGQKALERFVSALHSAARRSKTGLFGDNKIFISHLYRQMEREGTHEDMTLEQFKQVLLELNRTDHVNLSRADLAYAMDQTDVSESFTEHPAGATFHFMRLADQNKTGSETHVARDSSSKHQDDGPHEGERNAEGLVFKNGRWHREKQEISSLDKLRARIHELGGKEIVGRRLQADKAGTNRVIAKLAETFGLSREAVMSELGLRLKKDRPKKANKPGAKKTAPNALTDKDNPNSPNYRYQDTGYVAGSRKELAASTIKQAAKTGRRVNANEVDWEAIEENPREAKALITKSNLFGVVNWDALREQGMEPGAGFLIDRVYASIGTGPAEDAPQARKDYTLGLQTLRDRLERCKTVGDVISVIDEIKEESRGVMLAEGDAERYQIASKRSRDIFQQIKLYEDKNDKAYHAMSAANSEKYKIEREINSRQRRKWKISDELTEKLSAATDKAAKASEKWKSTLYKNKPIIEKLREDRTAAALEMRKIQDEAVERNARENPLTRAWNVLGERFNAVLNFRAGGYRYRGRSMAGSGAFRSHVTAAKNNKIPDWSWAENKGAHKAPKVKKESVRFQLKVADRFERVGGREIRPESTVELKNQFNLREVQSGNWVLRDPVSAKFHVENTAAAFADLADIIGVSDRDVSLNGRLAMAFGARGSGAKGWKDGAPRAHYESVHRVINLTKMGGGGSLGHEWAHALDNIVTEAITGKPSDTTSFVSENLDLLPPGELRDAFKAVRSAMLDGEIRAFETLEYKTSDVKLADYNINRQSPNEIAKRIKGADNAEAAVQAVDSYFEQHLQRNSNKVKKQHRDWRRIAVAYHDRKPAGGELRVRAGPTMSQFAANAADLDMGGKPYWSTAHEMFARAFQAHIEDALASMGRKNDYLSVYADNKYHVDPLTGFQWKPYPEGEERERINMAMERLLAVIRKQDVLAKASGMLHSRPLYPTQEV